MSLGKKNHTTTTTAPPPHTKQRNKQPQNFWPLLHSHPEGKISFLKVNKNAYSILNIKLKKANKIQQFAGGYRKSVLPGKVLKPIRSGNGIALPGALETSLSEGKWWPFRFDFKSVAWWGHWILWLISLKKEKKKPWFRQPGAAGFFNISSQGCSVKGSAPVSCISLCNQLHGH